MDHTMRDKKYEKDPVTVIKRSRKKNIDYGTWTVLKFSDGSTNKIQRHNSTESMGLPGWHLIDGSRGNYTYLADNEADAIIELLRRKNR